MQKIFCTIGPSSLNANFLKKIKEYKVSLLRINMSHTKLNELPEVVRKIRKYSKIPICIDTEGAQIRTLFPYRKFFKKNSTIKIYKKLKKKNFSIYPNIIGKIRKNSVLDIGFENLKIKIIKKNKDELLAKTISEGHLEGNKGVHIKKQKIDLPPLTAKDLNAIKIGKKLGIRNYALSFTNSSEDVIFFNKILKNCRKIFKIETAKGIKNLLGILKYCDEILIDRGDLSKDIGLIKIPEAHRKIQKTAKTKGKKVYVATNLLESMVKNSYPSRAEINDIYNCIELGASGLVLASETAIGKWPEECVKILSSIIKSFKKNIKKKK